MKHVFVLILLYVACLPATGQTGYLDAIINRTNVLKPSQEGQLRPTLTDADGGGGVDLYRSSKRDSLSKQLFTEPTINRLFGKRLAYYLSGSSDLSLYRNSATVNTSGFAVNNAFAFSKDAYSPIRWILNTGMRVPVSNGKGIVFQNGRVQQGITGLLSAVRVLGGRVAPPPEEDRLYMDSVRLFIAERLKREQRRERDDFNTIHADFDKQYPTIMQKQHADFEGELEKKYREAFHEEEESYGRKRLRWMWKHWIVANAEVPVSALEYNIVEPPFRTVTYWPFIAGLQYGVFYECQSVAALFTLNASVRRDNVIRFYNDFKGYVKKDSLPLLERKLHIKGVKNDTITLNSPYQVSTTFSVTPRVHVTLLRLNAKFLTNMLAFRGIAATAFPDIVVNPQFRYTNINVGLTFSLSKRGSADPINLELLGTFYDAFNTAIPAAAKSSPFTLTASLAVPLGSVIF
jgi:hypothetical protein